MIQCQWTSKVKSAQPKETDKNSITTDYYMFSIKKLPITEASDLDSSIILAGITTMTKVTI